MPVSTLPETEILPVRSPSVSSVAVAPGSVKVSPVVIFNAALPFNIMTGLVVSVGIDGVVVAVVVGVEDAVAGVVGTAGVLVGDVVGVEVATLGVVVVVVVVGVVVAGVVDAVEGVEVDVAGVVDGVVAVLVADVVVVGVDVGAGVVAPPSVCIMKYLK